VVCSTHWGLALTKYLYDAGGDDDDDNEIVVVDENKERQTT